jgi:hypothetical protein
MRFWLYDESGVLFRKFNYKDEAERFMQEGWKLVVQPKPKQLAPTTEEFGEARW